MRRVILIPGEVTFDSVESASRRFSEMLGEYLPEERVSDQDTRVLTALLMRHPRATAKMGCGIDHFEVRFRKHGAKCFHVVRTDGSVVGFSFHKAVKGAKLN